MITISHRHAEGTLVTGTRRGDGTNHIIKAARDGWRFSRHIGDDGAWYLPRSRDRHPDQGTIDTLAAALRAAGYQVSVHVDDTPRPPSEVEADHAAHTTARVATYRNRGQARHERGSAILADVDAERARIPLGQPDIRPADANRRQRRHRREQAGLAHLRAGQDSQQRAQAAEIGLRYRHNPRMIARRLETLEADRRRAQRQLDQVQAGGSHGEYADGGAYAHLADQEIHRSREHLADLQAQIAFWRSEMAELLATGAWAPWGPQHFLPGDQVLIGSWYPVMRVNRRSLTVQLPHADGQTRTGRAGYDTVYGRRRDGHTLHTPPPAPDAGCTELVTTESGHADQPAGASRCGNPPAARLSIDHDGHSCGCAGTCLPTHEDQTAAQRWTEVRLLCPAHLAANAAHTPAGVVELLHQPTTHRK